MFLHPIQPPTLRWLGPEGPILRRKVTSSHTYLKLVSGTLERPHRPKLLILRWTPFPHGPYRSPA